MDRFEHAWGFFGRVDIAAGSEAHAADDDRADIGEDVAEKIAGDDDVERFGTADELHRGAVDEERFRFDLRVVFGDLGEDFVPEDHAVTLGVAFGDGGDLLAGAFHRTFEGGANDPFTTMTGEDGRLDRDFARMFLIGAATDVYVFPFGVFAVDDEIDRACRFVFEGAFDTFVEVGGAEADVLVESAPDGEQESIERDMVLNFRMSDGTEEDGVEFCQLIEVVGGSHPAVCEVVIRPPGEFGPVAAGVGGGEGGIGDADRFAGDFGADSVSGDDGDFKCFHVLVVRGGWIIGPDFEPVRT